MACSIKCHTLQVVRIKIHATITCQKSGRPAAGRWRAGSVHCYPLYAQIETMMSKWNTSEASGRGSLRVPVLHLFVTAGALWLRIMVAGAAPLTVTFQQIPSLTTLVT